MEVFGRKTLLISLGPQTIIAGTRERAKFDRALIEAAKRSTSPGIKNPNDLWSVRPRQKEMRYTFDIGPGEDIARALIESIDRDLLFEPKPGMKVLTGKNDLTFETHGIDAFYTKTHPETGLFGFHRGSFDQARALIVADPHGIEDWR